jgi:hypothetical protein
MIGGRDASALLLAAGGKLEVITLLPVICGVRSLRFPRFTAPFPKQVAADQPFEKSLVKRKHDR